MHKEVAIPQGKYRIGRDVPVGVYLIEALNDFSGVEIQRASGATDSYDLGGDDAKQCHLELQLGDMLEIVGKVKIRRIGSLATQTDSDASANAPKAKATPTAKAETSLGDLFSFAEQTYGEDTHRFSRAKKYLREGRVNPLHLSRGQIGATVNGSASNPYSVEIRIDHCRGDHDALLPTKKEIAFRCNCPDDVSPCKHSLAVLLAFCEEMKTNPYILHYVRHKSLT